MISMYSLVLIRIPNAMKRQHKQWNKHVFPSRQNNERVDIVKLIYVFKNWTRYELQLGCAASRNHSALEVKRERKFSGYPCP